MFFQLASDARQVVAELLKRHFTGVDRQTGAKNPRLRGGLPLVIWCFEHRLSSIGHAPAVRQGLAQSR